MESRTLTDPAALNFLADAQNQHYLECFMAGERTVGQVAHHLNEPLQRVFRKVRQMLRLGFLEQSRLEGRAGRSLSYYQAVSRQFFVPFTRRSFEEVLLASNLHFEQRFVGQVAGQWLEYVDHNQGWGTAYTLDRRGRMTTCAPIHQDVNRAVPTPPHVFSWHAEWRLSPNDAGALLEELTALVQRYSQKCGESQPLFMVRLGLCPAVEPQP